MRNKTMDRLCRGRMIAVLYGVKAERLVPMADALLAGSIDCVQISYDPRGDQSDRDVAAQIKMLADHFGDTLCLGAGSVRKPEWRMSPARGLLRRVRQTRRSSA